MDVSNEKRAQKGLFRVKIRDEMLPSYVGILFNKQSLYPKNPELSRFFAGLMVETSRPQVRGLVRGNHFLTGMSMEVIVTSE